MIVRARPMMNPLCTGSEMNAARKPSRISPAASATSPVATASPAVRTTTSLSGPTVATTPAERAAVADMGRTTRCRDEPTTAYSTRAGTAAYSPTTGGTPAMVA